MPDDAVTLLKELEASDAFLSIDQLRKMPQSNKSDILEILRRFAPHIIPSLTDRQALTAAITAAQGAMHGRLQAAGRALNDLQLRSKMTAGISSALRNLSQLPISNPDLPGETGLLIELNNALIQNEEPALLAEHLAAMQALTRLAFWAALAALLLPPRSKKPEAEEDEEEVPGHVAALELKVTELATKLDQVQERLAGQLAAAPQEQAGDVFKERVDGLAGRMVAFEQKLEAWAARPAPEDGMAEKLAELSQKLESQRGALADHSAAWAKRAEDLERKLAERTEELERKLAESQARAPAVSPADIGHLEERLSQAFLRADDFDRRLQALLDRPEPKLPPPVDLGPLDERLGQLALRTSATESHLEELQKRLQEPARDDRTMQTVELIAGRVEVLAERLSAAETQLEEKAGQQGGAKDALDKLEARMQVETETLADMGEKIGKFRSLFETHDRDVAQHARRLEELGEDVREILEEARGLSRRIGDLEWNLGPRLDKLFVPLRIRVYDSEGGYDKTKVLVESSMRYLEAAGFSAKERHDPLDGPPYESNATMAVEALLGQPAVERVLATAETGLTGWWLSGSESHVAPEIAEAARELVAAFEKANQAVLAIGPVILHKGGKGTSGVHTVPLMRRVRWHLSEEPACFDSPERFHEMLVKAQAEELAKLAR